MTPLPPQSKITLKALSESVQLVLAQLRTLFESEAAAALNNAVGKVHSSFERSLELSRAFSQVHDHASFFELLTNVVAQIKAIGPGSSIISSITFAAFSGFSGHSSFALRGIAVCFATVAAWSSGRAR